MTQSLDRLRKQAKALKRAYESNDPVALQRIASAGPRSDDTPLKHADFLHVVAREEGFRSWPDLKAAVEIAGLDRAAKVQRLKIAVSHGQVQVAERLLAETPDLAEGQFGVQVALYDLDAVEAALWADPGLATSRIDGKPALAHLAFSRMIHAWPDRKAHMLAIAELLKARGADVNSGIPVGDGTHRLSVLYGAIGHADNMVLAEWLLANGADPNDNESLYHSVELGHHRGLAMLLKHGASPGGTNALPRALDFNDHKAVQMLLDAGADPNEFSAGEVGGEAPFVIPALHQAARRMCDAEMIDLLLTAGGDPGVLWNGRSAHVYAAVYGNAAALRAFKKVSPMPAMSREEALLAQAATGETPEGVYLDPAKLPEEFRNLIRHILHLPGRLDHVKRLVALGLEYDRVDPVEQITPVQVAGWNGLPEMMEYLLKLGPDLGFVNGYGGTLLSTIIHGSENCPERAERDHAACARIALEHGVALPKRAIGLAGDPGMQALLADWAQAHPGAVVESGVV